MIAINAISFHMILLPGDQAIGSSHYFCIR